MHAYIVQTRTDDVPNRETAGRADAEDGTHVVAPPRRLAPNAHRPPIPRRAWGAHGSSEYSAASAPVAVDRAGARVADGRDGSTRRARGGGGRVRKRRGTVSRGGVHVPPRRTRRPVSVQLRVLLRRVGNGARVGVARRRVGAPPRAARERGDERASSRRRESGPRRRGGARARFASSGRRFGERDERGGRCGGDCGGARDASRGEARRRRRRDFDPIPAQVKQELGVCGRDGRRRRRGGCPGRRARTRRVWRRVRGKRGRFRRRCGGGFRRWFGGSFRRFFPSRAIAAAGGPPPPPAPPEEGAARVFEIVASEPKKKGRCCAVGCDARWDRWTSTSDFAMSTRSTTAVCARERTAQGTRESRRTGRRDGAIRRVSATA